ncbi:22846_t:CDS:2, partial [Rhizophagus irregularis]
MSSIIELSDIEEYNEENLIEMVTKDTPCNFKKDNISCDGKPRLKRVTNYQTNIVSYFIGCNKYKQGDKWHRYIKIKQDEIDVSLLQSLFTGTAS